MNVATTALSSVTLSLSVRHVTHGMPSPPPASGSRHKTVLCETKQLVMAYASRDPFGSDSCSDSVYTGDGTHRVHIPPVQYRTVSTVPGTGNALVTRRVLTLMRQTLPVVSSQ